MIWRHAELDRLERAISEGARVQISRRGTEFVVLPQALRTDIGSEVLSATHPGTGEPIEFRLDEIDRFDVIG